MVEFMLMKSFYIFTFIMITFSHFYFLSLSAITIHLMFTCTLIPFIIVCHKFLIKYKYLTRYAMHRMAHSGFFAHSRSLSLLSNWLHGIIMAFDEHQPSSKTKRQNMSACGKFNLLNFGHCTCFVHLQIKKTL